MSYYKKNSMTSSVACWYNPDTNMLSNKGGLPGFIYFASQHELAVYRQLLSVTKFSSRNIDVLVHHVVTIKPPSQPEVPPTGGTSVGCILCPIKI
jgi:hypothetical protein